MDPNCPPSHMQMGMPTTPAHNSVTPGSVDELSDKQLTPENLQILMTFLRKNGLSETEEALSKEANNLLVMNEDVSMSSAYPSRLLFFKCFSRKNSFLVKMSKSSLKQLEIPLARTPTIKNIVKEHITLEASDVVSKLRSSIECQMGGVLGQVSKNEKRHKVIFVDSSFDFFQAEFSLLLFPVFAHSYVKLLVESSVNNAKEFFKRYCKRIPAPYEELVYKLERLQTAQQAQADSYVQLLLKNPFLVKMSKSSLKQLEIPLARTPTIKNIVKEHVTLEASDVVSKLRSSIECQMGGVLGQVSKNEKRHKMHYGVLKDDVSQAIEKKKTRGKELKDSKKSQALAPVPDRIPLPPLSEALREERRKAMRDANKLTLVSQECPPSVCMLTALNAYGGVSCCDISDDSSMLCIGFGKLLINMPNFNIFTYPTLQTAVIGLHFTRRNLLLAVGSYNA
ncbi:WD40 associated region in TFIID subunit [Oesophagostomum dentatum]|uniref:WD40 associated region in TFIID subunit n=1 Tax=Oesophagostomum dentatum TaxID=61180 RepID=A0A0B1T6P2_OESDE|nr:WD40 associated region in TFIID subunit [Oesophagostomum dentatum]